MLRVSDMQLVRLLPSLDDEVNCAAWSPLPGGGAVYGTKEGKLRLLQLDRCGVRPVGPCDRAWAWFIAIVPARFNCSSWVQGEIEPPRPDRPCPPGLAPDLRHMG